MVNCCVFNCSNRSEKKEKGITFHRFPVNEEHRSMWIKNVKIKNWTPSEFDRMCSVHFEEKWFYHTKTTRRLLSQAVPTIFPTYRSYLLPKSTVKRRRGNSPSALELQPEPGPSSLPDSPRKLKLRRQLLEAKVSGRVKAQKIKSLQQTLKRYKKKVISLKQIIAALQQQNLLSAENAVLLSNMSDVNRQILARKQHSKLKYSPTLRKFVITLNFLSPKAYHYIRRTFNTCLPHASTIGKWFKSIDCKPGFTTESLDALKRTVADSRRKLLCSLIIDEMAIRQHLEWDGRKYYGSVNFGMELDDDGNDLAKEAFVLLVVCVNGRWKIPCGYFLTAGLSAVQKKDLVCKCIRLVEETGVQIVSLTFDGAQSNISMSDMLGCQVKFPDLKTYFSFNNKRIHVFYDPPHMLKLIRNCFGEKKIFIDGDGRTIEWKFLSLLHNLQHTEGLHLGNKLRSAHIHFFKQKMKVRLAVQLLSSSVADALEYCSKILCLTDFANCEGTIFFIKIINNIFDILNSRTLVAPGFKKALSEKNIPSTKQFIKDAKYYISNLKYSNGELIINSKRKTGFVGFLVGLNSAEELFEEVVVKSRQLIYLPLYKIGQDHIELFFSSIRSRGGWNNNPTARQFTAAYKQLLIRAELREDGAGNCIPLEQIPILVCSSSNTKIQTPEQEINNSLPLNKSDLDSNETSSSIFQDHDYLMNSITLTEFSFQIIIYIAGFVVLHLQKKIKCEDCFSALIGKKANYLYSLITKKSRGGLIYPSNDVILICRKCEEYLRIEIHKGSIRKDNITLRLSNKVLGFFADKNIFECLNVHVLQNECNHMYFLMKAIAQKYIDIRIHFITTQQSEKSDQIRNWYTKMILFKGQ